MSFGYDSQGRLCVSLGSPRERPIQTFCDPYQNAFYLYDLEGIRGRLSAWRRAMPKIGSHYAMKANANLNILHLMRAEGFGVDVVSGGEIRRALEAGFKGAQIIFSGVAKTVAEMRFACEVGVKQFNVESLPELKRLAEVARGQGLRAPVALRLNPDVDARTHPYITTGFRENKFGIDLDQLPEIIALLKQGQLNLELQGTSVHIGSQLLEVEALRDALTKTKKVWLELKQAGFALKSFDIGGGLGINYASDDEALELKLAAQYGQIVEQLLAELKCEIQAEPGRFLVGRGGCLVCEVQYIKQTKWKKFIVIDSGMHHLLRPALYQAYHRILPLKRPEPKVPGRTNAAENNYDVVGPICESADFFAKDRLMPEVYPGDRLAIMDVGAYGAVLSNNYNLQTPAVELCW